MATVSEVIKPVMDLAVATATKVEAIEARLSALESAGKNSQVVVPPASGGTVTAPSHSFWKRPADASSVFLSKTYKPTVDHQEIKNRSLYGVDVFGSRARSGKAFDLAWDEINKLMATPDADLAYWKNGRYNKRDRSVVAYLLLTSNAFMPGGYTSFPDYAVGLDLDGVIAKDIEFAKKLSGDGDNFGGEKQGPSGGW